MEVAHARCCGIDVHRRSLTACLITPGSAGQPRKEIRRFGTMTDELVALRAWLAGAGCTHVALESTGTDWKPVWNVLEEQGTLVLANAQHIKALPGRKSDVKDCEWIADLLRYGLIRGSFVPPRPQRELRELTRYRTSLVRERSRELNRLQKTLEGANITLSQVNGVSAQAMLRELAAGNTELEAMANLAKGQLVKKRSHLVPALTGQVGAHQRFMLTQHLQRLDTLEAQLAELSTEFAARLSPCARQRAIRESLPGVGRPTAEVFLAEVGPELSPFPSAAHLASWAGLCPGSHQSAGKRHRGTTRKGTPWLKSALVEAGVATGRTKHTATAAPPAAGSGRRWRSRTTWLGSPTICCRPIRSTMPRAAATMPSVAARLRNTG
jgi:transposase